MQRRSVEIRKALGLTPFGPLSAERLATHLGVVVWSASDVHQLSKSDRTHLLEVAHDEWFAFVIDENDQFLIVYNPRMSPPRRNSVIMHELSHIILGHDLPAAEQTDDGHFISGNYSNVQEAEADWLAGTLLLPRPALLWMRSRRMSERAAMIHFGVSKDMLNWRIRMTGVDYQMRRTG